jgi:acyl dehydratase
MSDARVTVTLPAMPVAGALYRRAATGALRRSRPADLPTGALAVTGVRTGVAHLTTYARVCGFRLADALPATYPHVLAFPLAMRLMSDPAFPFPMIGLVHVANAVTVHRPVLTGDHLDLRVYAADLRPHERGRQFDLVATASVGGVEVWHGVSTYLRKGRPAGRTTAGPTPAPTDSGVRWPVGREVGRAYAAVSGDRNPIHTSRVGARLFGFPGPIAHGMWTKARCLSALEGRLPDAYTVEVVFKRPIPLPSTVSFTASRTDDGFALDVRGAVPHLTGRITA